MDPIIEKNIENDSNTTNGQSTITTNKPQRPVFRWKGKIVKEKTYKHRLALVEAGKNRKKGIEPELKIPVEGRRLVDIKLLAKHLKCTSCGEILSLRDIKSETRRGLASIFHVKCQNCNIINFVPSSGKRGSDDNPKRRFYDVNWDFVYGSTETGISNNRLNKLLGLMKVPQVQRPLFRRYKEEALRLTLSTASTVEQAIYEVPVQSATPILADLPTENNTETSDLPE